MNPNDFFPRWIETASVSEGKTKSERIDVLGNNKEKYGKHVAASCKQVSKVCKETQQLDTVFALFLGAISRVIALAGFLIH